MNKPVLTSLLQDGLSRGPAREVARVLSGRGGRSLTELAAITGYSKSTISSVLAELRRAGVVIELTRDQRVRGPSAGRPETIVSLNPEAGTAAGILIGLEHIQVVVADVAHRVLGDRTIRIAPDYSPEAAVETARELIDDIFNECELDRTGLLGAGLAVAAPINPRDGRVLRAGGVPTWAGKTLGEIFEPGLGCPIFADNESNCSAIAQMMWGVARDLEDFVLVTLDIGVGGAIVYGGRVVTGFAGSAGEFGHMTIDAAGPQCRCGNRGCLERYVADPLLALVHDVSRPRSLGMLVRDALAGDEDVAAVLRAAAEVAGRGLAIIGTVINPPAIIIGGEIALAGDMIMSPLRESFEAHTLVKATEVGEGSRTRFLLADHIENEGCIGAAGLVFRHHGRLV